MAYRLTPAERRALTMARINRDNPLMNYYQDNSIMQEQTDRIQPQESDANALVRGVHTVGDIVGNVLTGALKGLEGIYDFGAGIVGGIGGIFDDDFRDRVKEHIATDYVGNSVGNFLQDLTDQSYLKEGGFVENVAGGIGQMLPALAAAGITGGGSLVSLGTLGVSAAGGGTEEAFNDGAGYYQGLGYGAVRGATEVATEKLLGGADKLITGRGIFDGVKIAKQGLGRVVSEAINEGAEEVASELVNPLTRAIYKGTDAFKEYGDAEYWKGVAEAGLVGGATSVAFGQTVGRITGTSGKRGDINESLTEIKQAEKKLANLQAENNLTKDNRTKVNEIIKGNWANIERTLQSVNADKRQALIKQFNLENEVNEDGTIKDTIKQSWSAEMSENDYYNRSVSLQGNAKKTNKDLGTIKQGMAYNLIDEANGIDEQKANEMVGDVSLFNSELTDKQKQNRSKFMKALSVLNKKGNAKTTFAILNPNKYFSANVTDGTLYIGADSFETDQWAKDLVHEVTHLEEGTKEYNKLFNYLKGDDILVDDGKGGKISLYTKAANTVRGKGYGIETDTINNIIEKVNNDEILTAQEYKVYNLFKSELTAHESELYLGSEAFIDKIIESDTSLAKKIFDKIFNTKQALQKVDKNNPEVKRLLKAEKLWLDASKRIGNIQLAKYIQGKEKELEEKLQEGVESEGHTQFNLKQTDSLGNELSQEQIEFFKDSKVRDEDGNLLVVYHGTSSKFTVFDYNKTKLGKLGYGFYFTANKNFAKNYAVNDNLVEAYIKATNPLVIEETVLTEEQIDKMLEKLSEFELEAENKTIQELKAEILAQISNISKNFAFLEIASKYQDILDNMGNVIGFDGIVAKNWNEYVVFEPNQVKSTTNKKPTSNPDIRFNLKIGNETVTGEAETTKNLVALHNLREDNLLDTIKLGGFPMPSIAITKVDMEHENYGDITVVFGKDTIDPALLSENKVYGSDAWTPTSSNARVEYEVDYEALRAFEKKLAELGKRVAGGTFSSDSLVRRLGIENVSEQSTEKIAERLSDFDEVRAAYLAEKGKTIEPEYKEKVYNKHGNKALQTYMDQVGVQHIAEINALMKTEDDTAYKVDEKVIRKIIRDKYADEHKSFLDRKPELKEQKLDAYMERNVSSFTIEDFVKDAWRYYQEGGTVTSEIDRLATSDKLRKLVDDREVRAWLEPQIEAFLGEKGIYNGKDPFDSKGKSRSFSQLHYAYTAENIVKAMKETASARGANTMFATANTLIATATPEYKSINEMHADESRLKIEDAAVYEATINEIEKALENVEKDIMRTTKRHTDNSFDEMEIIGSIIANAATGKKSIVEIQKVFAKEDYKITPVQAKRVLDLYSMAEKVSTGYFEAKPERVVGLDEIKMVLIPDTASQKLRNYLNNAKIPFQEYEKEQGRTEAIKRLDNVRFNLKSNPQISLSNGEIRKLVANYTRPKVYSRNETEISINNLIEELGELFTTEKISLKGKSKEEAIQMLWQGLNTVDSQDRQAFAEKVAEYIIKNSIVESTYKDADYDYYADVYNVLHSYVQKFNLDHIKTEIEHKYGKEKAKGIIARWQSKDGTGMSVDGYAEEINELGFRIDETKEAEIFFAINDAYEKSLEKLKKEASTSFNQFLNDSEAIAIKDGLTQEILDLFKTTGQISDKTKQRNAVSKLINNIVKKYNDKARRWRNKYKLLKETERATRTLVKKINKIAEFKEGVFWNATQYKTDAFKGSIEKLTKLIHNGNLNQSTTRDILKSFLEWYKKENPMLEGYFDESIAKAIDDLANNRKPLTDEEANLLEYLENKSGLTDINEIVKWYTVENLHKKYDNFTKDWLKELASPKVFNLAEIKALTNFIDHVNHIAKDYKKVYRNGKLVDAQPLAEEYIKIIKKNAPVKVGWLQKFWRWYLKAFGDPMAYARYVDRYNGNGFYTEMLEKFRKASTDAAVMEMEFRKELDEFLDKHSKWQKNLKDRTVEYNGHKIPMVNAIALYMTLNREQALLGLAESGFVYKDKDGNKKDVSGFAIGKTKTMTMDELVELAQKEQTEIRKGFSEIELEYIAIVEKIFNEQCKKAKADADMKMRGYTNIIDGYYYPIMREGIADSVDTSTMFEVQNRVSNASFNKDTVKGAKQKLFIDNALTLADRHIKGISMYANLGAVVNEYDMLMNLDISGNPNDAVSVKLAGKDAIYQDANAYFKQMVSDIQGIRDADTIFTKGLRAIRSNYVRFQLGANPKTLVTQLSSLFASTSILDYGSIVRGFGISGKDVDKYSPLAMLRNYDQSAYKAEGVLDKTGGIGDFLMKPIGKIDRFVITKLFGACQVQVEKNGGAKVGTEANKIEAGKLLEQVIYETQQNSLATERSAAMRSKNELVKGLVMFSSDAMKVAGRFIDSVGHYVTLKARLKHTTVQTEIDAINKELKDAKKQLGKSTGALVTTSIFMSLVAQAFRYAFAKDDEDDNVAVNMTVDAVGNLLGGLPLFKDAYSFIADGYDLDMYAYSTINDFLSSVGKLMDIKWTDSRSITSAIKDLSFSLGQLSGIPSRNIYNTIYGLTKRFSPETAYKFDNILYKPSFKADLQKAIENDDDDMISVIAGLMLDENIGGMNDADARHTMTDLIGKGYDILPRSVGDTITYDDETYELTNRQKNQFKKVYNASNEAVANMVKLAQFKEASDDVKAKAIKYIYNVYYNLALQDFLGVSLENKNILFAEAIDIEKLALISASANSIKADTDKNGKQISGSRKKKIQEYVNSLKMKAVEKYMIMGYLGYTNIYGENQVKAYINRLKLSKDEKSLLLSYSGYKVA